MANRQQPSKAMHYTLWAAQWLLSSSLIWSGCIKLLQPVDKLAAMWPWVAHVSPALVRFTGVIDLLGAAGLVLPALLRVQPRLTILAASGIIALMVCATIFHVSMGDTSKIGVNIAFAAIAAFIAWGRAYKAPIAAR